MADGEYNVVFECTSEARGYAGVRTWSSWNSQKAFEDFYTTEIARREKVIAKDVTPEEAINICGQTPLRSDLSSCLQEATNPRTGKIHQEVLKMKLTTVLTARPRTLEEIDRALQDLTKS
jgi:hypothetical protein